MPKRRFLGGGGSSIGSRSRQRVRNNLGTDNKFSTRRIIVFHVRFLLIGLIVAICGGCALVLLLSHVAFYANDNNNNNTNHKAPLTDWLLLAHKKQQSAEKIISPSPSPLQRPPPNITFLMPPLGQNAELLPDWMEDYVAWHATQRTQLTVDNFQNYRFLVLRCLHVDPTCGGISDRLKPLPLLIQLAAASKRILLITWQRPAPLEEFLLPIGGSSRQQLFIDWRVPSWLPINGVGSRLYSKTETLVRALNRLGQTVVMTVKLQDQHGGSQIYNALEEYRLKTIDGVLSLPLPILNWTTADASALATTTTENGMSHGRAFRRVFRTLWSILFVPSPSVAAVIRRQQEQSELPLFSMESVQQRRRQQHPQPSYVAAHVRAYYGNHPIPPERRAAVAINALQCANALRKRQHYNIHNDNAQIQQQQQQPVLLLSDSRDILQAGIEYQQRHPHLPIHISSTNNPGTTTTATANISISEPLHLDKSSSRVAADYFSIFVDLYLLANADCVAHGQGGFGRFGSLLSRNASCVFKYFDKGQFVDCSS